MSSFQNFDLMLKTVQDAVMPIIQGWDESLDERSALTHV